MSLVLFALWIIFCGRLSADLGMAQILVIGAVVTTIIRIFMAKALGMTFRAELLFWKRLGYILAFAFLLLFAVLKANFSVIFFLTHRKRIVDPVIVRVCIPLREDLSKTLLACAITLTPGTITVDADGDVYTVHCLDRSMAEGLETGAIVRLLTKMDKLSQPKPKKTRKAKGEQTDA